MSERNLVLSLKVDAGQTLPKTFQFPEANLDGVEMSYKHYADADLVEVKPELALSGIRLRPQRWWPWILGFVVLAAGMATSGFAWMKRRGHRVQEVHAPYRLPGHLTPFSVLNLLRRMAADAALGFDGATRRDLEQAIRDLEAQCFERPVNGRPAPDVETIARRWVSQAN